MVKKRRRTPTETPLGERIRTLRERRGLTQEGLAAACGLGRATIAHLETGIVTSARSDTLTRLAMGLGVKVATILSPHKPHKGHTAKPAA